MRPSIALGVQSICADLCDRTAYFAAFTIAMPKSPSPALIRPNSLRDFRSTTDTSFDLPFAV